ncbi:MAG: Phenylacetic acid catabolic protein, partial [Ilumatobacteraceae bacterium]
MAGHPTALLTYTLRQADRTLVLAQRLLEVVTHSPEIEEDMALSNLALDLLGQARTLYTRAGVIEGDGHDEDHFVYWRDQHEFLNPLLCEQP